MSNIDRYRPIRAGRSVYQSGLDMRERGAPRRFAVQGPLRAVVVETHVTDSADRSDVGSFPVEADVILVRTGLRINFVPVMQPGGYGVHNAQPWVPRKTTRSISGGKLNTDAVLSLRGDYQGGLTPLDDMDGDHVLVDFIEGDPSFPIVIGAVPHRQSSRAVVEGNGWSEANDGSERGQPHDAEHYLRHAGFEFRVNGDGDVLLDTVGATSDRTAESPEQGGGQIRLRVKDSQRFTVEMDGADVLEVSRSGAQVRIDLGEGATESVILGDAFMALFNAHTHPDPVGGTTGTPLVPMTAAQHLSDLAKVKKA